MSGDHVLLSGPTMDDFVASLKHIVSMQPVIIGGLAVMARVGGEHRPTLDIDSTFNNESDTGTTTLLVAKGIASDRLLMGTPWQLRSQVLSALTEDLGQSADRSMAAALLRSSPIKQIQSISDDLLETIVAELFTRLSD